MFATMEGCLNTSVQHLSLSLVWQILHEAETIFPRMCDGYHSVVFNKIVLKCKFLCYGTKDYLKISFE